MTRLLCVVEGYGEVKAAPPLIRRVASEKLDIHHCEIETHRRGGISHLRANNWSKFRRYIEAAFLEDCPILWMLDCEDDCPSELMPQINDILSEIHIPVAIAFVLWYREYETMFLFDLNACSKWAGREVELKDIRHPKAPRSAKDCLSGMLDGHSKYKETAHQARLTCNLNIDDLVANYDDFEHFFRVLSWLLKNDAKDRMFY